MFFPPEKIDRALISESIGRALSSKKIERALVSEKIDRALLSKKIDRALFIRGDRLRAFIGEKYVEPCMVDYG